MFVVLLRFSTNSQLASRFMAAHNAWIENGFDDGVILLIASLEQGAGGAILANGVSREQLQQRLAADPFVAEQVVTAEILELTPNRADERLAFLLEQDAGQSGGKNE